MVNEDTERYEIRGIQKVSKLKIEKNNEQNISFLQNNFLGILNTYSSEFCIC